MRGAAAGAAADAGVLRFRAALSRGLNHFRAPLLSASRGSGFSSDRSPRRAKSDASPGLDPRSRATGFVRLHVNQSPLRRSVPPMTIRRFASSMRVRVFKSV